MAAGPTFAAVLSRGIADMAIGWFAAHVPYGAALALGSQFRAALAARERRGREA